MLVRTLSLALFFTALSACRSGPPVQNGEYHDDEVHYRIATPGSAWNDAAPGEANAAWINDPLKAILMVNSHCTGVDDAPLTALTRHLAFGMTEREWLSEERLEASGREALESVLLAKLDGVERKFIFFVLKKDGCVYDVMLSAPPENFSEAKKGYDRVLKKFQVLPRADFKVLRMPPKKPNSDQASILVSGRPS